MENRQGLKVAIVGCGKIADGHVEAISKAGTAHIVAACDIEPLMAEQLAIRYGIPRQYSDFDRLVETERPDVIHIATPPQSHSYLARRAMRAGCHVYVEKPFAETCAQAKEIIDVALETGRKLTVNYWPNFDPPALSLDRLMQAGILGDIVHVESYYGYDLSGIYGESLLSNPNHWVHKLPGRLFQNVLDHIVNKIVLFLPDAQPEVRALAWRQRPAEGRPLVDQLLDELRFVIRGNTVSAYGTFSAHSRPVSHFLRVYGTRNSVHVDYANRTVTMDPYQTVPTALGRLLPAFGQSWRYLRQAGNNMRLFARSEFHYLAGMRRLVSLLYNSILNDGPVPIPYNDILRVASFMDCIHEQVYPSGADGGRP